ncbi:MAG: protein kinase [Acidobacteria bacterium]|nr:protein kinase [Acidobacteriota bacterium]
MTNIKDLQLEAGSLLIDRYLIVKRIGGGGMGSVYLARDKRLADSSRAVKEMIGMHADENQRKKAIDDFERESQLLASLDHPAIPTIYDYFISEGRYYLVMRYINGGDLAQKLKAAGGILDEKTVTEWGIQIADVLHYLHSQNPQIIYRDMKPANIMLDEREKVVLVDFGIARFVSAPAQRVTAIGTMGYAPPELFAGKVEPRSDIYSLGATMFHLLTGRDPQDNPLLMFDFNRNPRPKQINPKISDGMDKILAKSVEHKPANRFSSAGEMRDVLEQHLRQITGDFRPVVQVPVIEAQGSVNFCGQCGSKVTVGNAFCQNCGAPQKPDVLPPVVASLVYVDAESQQISFVLGKETSLVGRLDNNRGIYPDIDLSPFDKDGKISRRHAIIHRSGDKVSIEDLGSTNGTYINRGERLQPKKTYLLNSGDEICLGETFVKFFIGTVPSSLLPPAPLKGINPQSSSLSGANKPSTSPSINKSTLPDAVKASFVGANVMSPPPPPPPANFQPKVRTGVSAAKQVSASKGAASEAIPVQTIEPSDNQIPNSEEERDVNGKYILKYFSNIKFSKEVKLGETIALEVGLIHSSDQYGNNVEKPNFYDGEIPLAFPDMNASTSLAMEIYIAAPGFEVEPDIFARFNVGLKRSANAKPFQLKAVQLGSTVVTVDFYQDTDYLTSVSIETTVVA